MTEQHSVEINKGDLDLDHAHEFVCTDCGDHIHKYGDHDGLPVCATCRYIREFPDMPEHIKECLRGSKVK
ncbi:hypothetical protein [Bradyrhizobium sp. S3.7.6]